VNLRTIGARRQRHALQMQACGDDQAARNEVARFRQTALQRAFDLVLRQLRHGARDRHVAEVAVGLHVARRHAQYARIARQIHRIGDHRRGRIRLRGAGGQHRDGVGYAKRETASARARRRNSAHAIRCANFGRAEQRGPIRSIDEADAEALAFREMQRDVAAVVDVSAHEAGRRFEHRRKHFVGDAPGHRRHRGNEHLRRVRPHGVLHAS
jgi:hypothetical protein